MVQRMLSPMLRSENLGHADVSDTSISAAVPDPCSDLSSGKVCSDSNVSLAENHVTSSKAALPKLPLQLIDESNACIDLLVGEEKTIKLSSSSPSILIYVDWSQNLLEKYESHYLENLPEVFKYGPVTKKARNEPLSLYTCLEAFLREEPLVPEDMWLDSSSSNSFSLHNDSRTQLAYEFSS